METIKGSSFREFPLKELTKVADLEYFEGPLLSLFKNNKGDQYLYYWCDCDELVNRWLVFRVSDEKINAFLSKRISLRDLILQPADNFLFSVDLDHVLNQVNSYLIEVAELPELYIPDVDSLYDSVPRYRYKSEKSWKYKLKIAGEWSLGDLSKVPSVYSKAYYFLYFLQQVKQLPQPLPQLLGQVSLPKAFGSYPWRGGFSAMRFYNDLSDFVAPEHQLKIASLQYASPGWIEINLLESVAFSIRNAVTAFMASSKELGLLYQEFYKELGIRGLLRDPNKPKNNAREKPKIVIETRFSGLSEVEFAKESSTLLVRFLRLEKIHELENVAGSHLITLKILLSFYRKIEILARYQSEGKVQY